MAYIPYSIVEANYETLPLKILWYSKLSTISYNLMSTVVLNLVNSCLPVLNLYLLTDYILILLHITFLR